MHRTLAPIATRHNLMSATNDPHRLLHNHQNDVLLANSHALRHGQMVHNQLHRVQNAHRHPACHLMLSAGFWQLGTCLTTHVALRFSSNSWIQTHYPSGSLKRISLPAVSPRRDMPDTIRVYNRASQLRSVLLRVQQLLRTLMHDGRLYQPLHIRRTHRMDLHRHH